MLKMYVDYYVAVLSGFLQQYFGVKSQKGVTMIEYALIASLIAVAVIAVLLTVGSNLQTVFSYVGSNLTT
ncbi:hypothetical protein CT0425 [Chlorobaculum tepidum TLS]|uniref:Uncharacterized protein n=1 Tax=Chlorobaculum tepidum (strain ATCC 49652 / DSM 12025 / NBRC 103806 / TLS) TaxID=194439 RepID=Q8KFA2_CHLTE|nr:Flp family type IVb pilin [Chlorobaculum tepidum]AAM71671.1 hypothetical protein CT0425 [Chlorobaculum tepidum TLS]